jgi:serine/threonine protein kinase
MAVSGSRIGPYEIIALIGSGEMGEVYRARDTKLEVAAGLTQDQFDADLKTLPRSTEKRRSTRAASPLLRFSV